MQAVWARLVPNASFYEATGVPTLQVLCLGQAQEGVGLMEERPTYLGPQVRFTGHLLRDGFVQLNNSIIRSKRLKVNDKMIFALLLSRAGQQGESWPTHASIGADLDVSRWSVMRSLKTLASFGLVSWKARGQGRSCMYLLHEEAISSFISSEPSSTSAHQEVAPAHIKKLQFATSRSSTHATQKNTQGRIPREDKETSTNVDVKKETASKKKEQPVEIPEWLITPTWQDFLEMRKHKRATPTNEAIRLLVKKLSKMREQGEDIKAVLEQSILRNYTDVFSVRADSTNNSKPTAKRTLREQMIFEAEELEKKRNSPEHQEHLRKQAARFAASNELERKRHNGFVE